MDELNEIKNSHNIGDELKLKINRDGNEKEITIILGEQPQSLSYLSFGIFSITKMKITIYSKMQS